MSRLNLEDSDIRNPNFSGKLKEDLVMVPDAAAYTVLAVNSGRVHVMPDLTNSMTITLPAHEKGLNYEFWYGGAAADGQNWIFNTLSDLNFFVGGVVFMDQDGDALASVFSDGNSNSKFTIVTPEAGTRVKFVSDGAKWYVNGQVHSATTPTMADQ